MSMYVGLCIGGIADGEWVKSESPILRRAIFPEVPPVNEWAEKNPEEPVSVNTDDYRIEVLRIDNQVRYLFVIDGMPMMDAIDELMGQYANRK